MGELLSWHRVGQKVVCVDAGFHWNGDSAPSAPQLKEGEVYCVCAVHISLHRVVGLSLQGKETLPGFPLGFTASRFRPVRTTSIDCFLSLLTPSPDTVRKMEEVG